MFGSINMVLAVITGELLEKTPMSFARFFEVKFFMPVIF